MFWAVGEIQLKPQLPLSAASSTSCQWWWRDRVWTNRRPSLLNFDQWELLGELGGPSTPKVTVTAKMITNKWNQAVSKHNFITEENPNRSNPSKCWSEFRYKSWPKKIKREMEYWDTCLQHKLFKTIITKVKIHRSKSSDPKFYLKLWLICCQLVWFWLSLVMSSFFQGCPSFKNILSGLTFCNALGVAKLDNSKLGSTQQWTQRKRKG